MISSGRILGSLTRCHKHSIIEMLSVPNRYQQCMKVLQSRYFALPSSSTTDPPDMLDREEHKQFHKSNRTKINQEEVRFNLPKSAQISGRTHSETEIDFSQTDPDTFGNLKGNIKTPIEAIEGDEGDKDEETYLEYVPTAAQKLSIKKYSNIIKDFFSHKKVADAIDILETRMLKEDRVKPDNYIYNIIITECGRLGYTKKAFQLYNQMKKRALKVTGATYTGLFNACANSPWSHDGLIHAKHLRQLMFEKGYEPNTSNYHAMIKAFGRCRDLSTAFSLVDEMAEKDIPISDETFNFLLQACITDKEAGFRHSLLVWRKIVQRKVRPTIFTYNLLLRSIRDCGLGDLDVAQDVFHRITDESNKTSTVRPLLAAGNEDSLRQPPHSAQENITSEPTSLVPPILENHPNLLAVQPHFGNIIALSEVTKPEDRMILVGGCSGFLEQMNKDGVKPDIKTFTQLLDTTPSTKSAEQALLSAMKKAHIQPDIDFYNMLIRKRSLRFDYKNAHEVLKLIQIAKLNPDIITFGVLALGCQTEHEAQHLIADMRNAGFRMNAEILGAMLRQGCCHFNFDYVLAIMETTIEEEVRPNEKFLAHLENFHKICREKMNKDTELPQFYKDSGGNKFKKNFQRFCARYNSWLEKIVPEKLGHPWEQFQKKTQTNKNTAKEDKKVQRRNKMRNN